MNAQRFYKNKLALSILYILLISLLIVGCKGNLINRDHQPTAKIKESNHSDLVDETNDITGKLKIHFLDVGQADCILIEEPTGHNMLIDAGNNGDADFIYSYLKEYNIKQLDYAIGTHPHEDHIGSLDMIINNFEVKNVIMPDVPKSTQTFGEVIQAIANKELLNTIVSVGQEFSLGQSKFTILAPNSNEYDDTNDYSIVIKLQYGNNTFVFTGDAETKSEHEMVASGMDLSADLLKVGHHGSGTSTIAEFLYEVNPKYAVISVGTGNKYGHPDDIIMNRLKIHEVEVYRTDEVGTIIASSDGTNITIDKNASVIDVNTAPEEQTKKIEKIEITEIDKKAEYVVISNKSGVDVDLTGWKVVSVNGSQTFIFPSFVLKAGQNVKVAGYGAKNTGDIIWEEGKGIWNNIKDDPGELYDKKGKLIDRY
ncbi:MAG: MBL fold metallo-hydrolase [Vallitalea sp.]|jgi:competence protein ComEC|nr:MBL fold metallo-hydrolase [Vallitalea sp.]